MPVVALSFWGTLLADVVGWAVVHAVTGWAVHRLPVARLAADGLLLRPHRVERGGRLYTRGLRIRRWKDHLPEAGALLPGGVSKRDLGPGLERFVVETRRAEVGHWLAVACTPVFALWNPPSGVVLMLAYALAANVPCIAVQRYNRQRAQRVLALRSAGGRRQGP